MKIILLSFFFIFSTVISASTFYLAPNGSDNNIGSYTSPFFTLNKAWSAVKEGDTIYLRGGTYRFTSQQFLTEKNGSAGKMIQVFAYPGETPIITKGTTFVYGRYCGVYFSGNYCHFKGLEITGFNQLTTNVWFGLRAENSNNNIFELLNIHDNGAGIGLLNNSNNNLILNCDSHHNYDPITNNDPYGNADGIEIADIPAGNTNTVRGCRVYRNSDDGIDLWNNDGTVIIDNCWSWNNGYKEDGESNGGDGNGFKLGATKSDLSTTHLRTITNSIAFDNRAGGFVQNNGKCVSWIYNNTGYHNADGEDLYNLNFQFSETQIKHILKNNIAYANQHPSNLQANYANCIISNNSWNKEVTVSDADFISLEGTQLTRPRKADGSLPDIEFLHLASGSDLIDAGADVGKPYYGKAPDIGAFEIPVSEFHLNEPPVVSISSPSKGITFTSPATVTIDVEASDPDGSISKVELYNGAIKLDERTTAPYSFTLKDLPAGSYSLKAVAIDNLKAANTSATLDLKVTSFNEDSEFFNLYPNPNGGRFTINFTSPLVAENYTVTIFNLIGRRVYREELSKDDDSKQFDVSHLNPGTYILTISSNKILLTQKFIKG